MIPGIFASGLLVLVIVVFAVGLVRMAAEDERERRERNERLAKHEAELNKHTEQVLDDINKIDETLLHHHEENSRNRRWIRFCWSRGKTPVNADEQDEVEFLRLEELRKQRAS